MITIGNLARRTGVRPSAIRYYETQGLLRPAGRSAAGYRLYDDEAPVALQLLRAAQSLGFRLAEVRELMELVNTGVAPCDRVRALAATHLREIEQRIRDLIALRRRLRGLLHRAVPPPPHEHAPCPLLTQAGPRLEAGEPAGSAGAGPPLIS